MRATTLVFALALVPSAAAQTTLFEFVDPNTPGVGWAVRGLGDVSGDGTPDVAVGTFRQDCGFGGCGAAPSRLVVLSGAAGSVLYDLAPSTPDGTGYAIDVVDDLDGDLRPELVVGAPYLGGPVNPAGEVRVHSGANGALLFRVAASGNYENFGSSVAGLGDVDGDLVPDLAATTWNEVRVLSGAGGAQLLALPSPAQAPFRCVVARYEDFDGDGHADVLVGYAEGGTGSGFAEIRSGLTGGVLQAFVPSSNEPTFGWAVAAIGDVDGDGRSDVVVGAPQVDLFANNTVGPGFVALYSATGALLHQVSGTQAGAHLGYAVAGGLDLDGDGRPDFVAAASCEVNAATCVREATAYSSVTGAPLFTVASTFAGEGVASVDLVGDLDGDTRSEVAFGTACSEPWSQCGEALVVANPLTGPVAYCTAGVSGQGCVPSIAASGTPSASASSGFTVSVAGLDGQRQGILFYGIDGRLAQPWGTGSSFLCVKSPAQRTAVQGSGGTPLQCDGALAIDWLAYVAANPTALGAPFQAGDVVDVQAWYRDPPSAKSTSLSNALEFVLAP